MNTFLIVLIILETVALILLGFVFFRNNKAYLRIIKKAERITKGELNVEDILTGDSKGNPDIIAGSFDAIKNNLMTFIESTKVNVITLSDAIEVLSRSVNANQAGNEQIAQGVTEVAQKSVEQLDMVEKNVQLIESNKNQVEEIEELMKSIRQKLDDTVNTSKKGIQEIGTYAKDVDQITNDLSNINVIMEKFNDEIRQIEEVGDFILSINNQLMMLALNASIEAARAGQAGKGFVVVADQMNKMSADTKEGMEKITGILGEIINSSTEVNESIHNCESAFNKSKETFEIVDQSFKTINEQAFTIHSSVQEISSMTGRIADNSKELQVQSDGLYDASHQISETTHEIAAASEETAAESSQISVNVNSLNGMLGDIQNLLKQFNTAVVPTEKTASKEIKIAFLTMLDNEFWFGVRKGAFFAKNELNGKKVLIDYIPLGTDDHVKLEDQVHDKIQDLIRKNYDGIIFPGFLNAAVRDLQDAISKGIKVISFNCDCNPSVKRLAVFSPNGFEAGSIAGKQMVKALSRHGNISIITGDLAIQVNKERRDGFMKKISAEKNMHVVSEDALPDVADTVYKKAIERLEQFPDLSAIYVTSGLQASVAKAIEDKHRTGKVVVVGFDDNQEIFKFIKKGIIYATITQDPFGQGHDPIIWLYNHLVTGESFPQEQMGCRLSVINQKNVANLIM